MNIPSTGGWANPQFSSIKNSYSSKRCRLSPECYCCPPPEGNGSSSSYRPRPYIGSGLIYKSECSTKYDCRSVKSLKYECRWRYVMSGTTPPFKIWSRDCELRIDGSFQVCIPKIVC